MIRLFSLVLVLVFISLGSSFAITDPKYKTKIDLYLESPALVREAPTWFTPTDLADAPEEISHWISLLPYKQDKNAQRYLVIPQLGLITPIVLLDPSRKDYQTMIKGGQIDINAYLDRGVLEYAGGAEPGYIGHSTIFGHSNQYKNAAGDYKTIFASLFRLDPSDQVWVYDKQSDGDYKLFKYEVTQSYLTNPKDVGILQYDGEGGDMTVFGCAHGLDYRWVVKTTYLGDPIDPRNLYGLPWSVAKRLDVAIQKIYWLPDDIRREKVAYLQSLVEQARKKPRKTDMQQKLLDYLDYYLPQLLP